jgi:hypothetical protein
MSKLQPQCIFSSHSSSQYQPVYLLISFSLFISFVSWVFIMTSCCLQQHWTNNSMKTFLRQSCLSLYCSAAPPSYTGLKTGPYYSITFCNSLFAHLLTVYSTNLMTHLSFTKYQPSSVYILTTDCSITKSFK